MRKIILLTSLLLAGQSTFIVSAKTDKIQARSSSIYKKGWIDFNKNGQKDVY